ncbi:MAG: alpha/beta fold hydrolase [Bacteroidia bacterium]
MANVLILHGNGGSRTRFVPMLKRLIPKHPELDLRIPELSGFDGRAIPKQADHWSLFMSEIEQAVHDKLDEPWILYGHGIGGSLLLEFAARDFTFPSGERLTASKVILQAPIGATLKLRKFPALMKPPVMRALGKWLLTRKMLRPLWEKRLFQAPKEIPEYLREQFFHDYTQCEAFGVFFDLITPKWYEEIRTKVKDQVFHFVWGEEERVINVGFVEHWRQDFPSSQFEIVPDWDHFPMLEQTEEFVEHFLSWTNTELPQ